MIRAKFLRLAVAMFAILIFAPCGALHAQQKLDSLNQGRVRGFLRDAYDAVKKNYYDPKYHGIDWDARYHEFNEKMQTVGSMNESFLVVAHFLDALNDSHTFFSPPSRSFRLDYGFRGQLVGDNYFIVRIRPGTDAEQKLHPGDQVLTYNNFRLSRADAWKAEYMFGALTPQEASHLTVQSPDGQMQDVEVKSKVQQLAKVADLTGSTATIFDIQQMILDEQNEDHANRHRWVEDGDMMIWKMPEFDLNDRDVDRLFGIARKHKTLILDLRDNPGGSVATLERMIGNVMDHDVKIADRVGRRELKPMVSKTRGGSGFSGALIVLVDSNSASAAELFSRVIQLEHRGTVLGDHTAGAVMEARGYAFSQGLETKIFYSFSVTDANLLMADGKSLEHDGVTPDEIILPSAEDLAAGRDPVLSRAADLAGMNLDPVEGGKIFPYEWVPFR